MRYLAWTVFVAAVGCDPDSDDGDPSRDPGSDALGPLALVVTTADARDAIAGMGARGAWLGATAVLRHRLPRDGDVAYDWDTLVAAHPWPAGDPGAPSVDLLSAIDAHVVVDVRTTGERCTVEARVQEAAAAAVTATASNPDPLQCGIEAATTLLRDLGQALDTLRPAGGAA